MPSLDPSTFNERSHRVRSLRANRSVLQALLALASLVAAACSSEASNMKSATGSGGKSQATAQGGTPPGSMATGGSQPTLGGSRGLGGAQAALAAGGTGSSLASGGVGAGSGGLAGASGAGPGAGGAPATPCPTSAPADITDADIRARCTKRIYIAGGDDFRLTLSVDEGQTWKRIQPINIDGDDFVNDIIVSGGVVTMIGLPGAYASSDRGQTFSIINSITHNGFDTYGGLFTAGSLGVVLTDNEGTYLSTNGALWARKTPFPNDSPGSGFGGHYHGKAFGNGIYVIFQDSGKFRTWDGNTWFSGAVPDSDIRGVAFGGNHFVAVGKDGTGGFFTTSTDGKTWASFQYKDNSNNDLQGQPTVVFDGTQFIIYTIYGGNASYTSPDGTSWTKRSLGTDVQAAVFDDGAFFGINGSQLLLSDDGTAWRKVHDLGADETSNINGPRLTVGRVLK